jgi:glutathione S-transferase
MVTLFHSPETRSIKVRWLLEELGIEYRLEERKLERGAPMHSQDVPGGKFPAIRDGDVEMIESGAIVEYLLDRYGDGRLSPPRESPQWAKFLQWMYYAEGTAFPPLQNLLAHTSQLPEAQRSPVVVATETPWAHGILRFVDDALEGRSYLLGEEFSAADIMMGFSVFFAQQLDLLSDYENIGPWLARLQKRPALHRALSRSPGANEGAARGAVR